MNVRFHLPGLSSHFRFNLVFAEMLKAYPQFFREGVEIASVYGTFPPALWNGGRTQQGICDKRFIKTVLSSLNSRGIPARFTFTNPMIEKKHLSDKFCNMILSMADNGLNECIVMSPILEDYIRNNFPKYKLTSSTCKRITDAEKLYEEVGKDYHIVVIDYDLNHEFDVLEGIPNKEKCELLVNACCNPQCEHRSHHYETLGLEQIAYANHVRKYPDTPFDADKFFREHPESSYEFECRCMNRTIFEAQKLKNHITPDEIWGKYVPMGFSQFKIEGRTLSVFNLLETYLYYMAKPEYKDELRLKILEVCAKNEVIEVLE